MDKVDTERAEAKRVAQEIVKKGRAYSHIEYEMGSTFSRALIDELRGQGFTSTQTYSSCNVASTEAHLASEAVGVRVEIVTACFMGVFTKVTTQPF